MAEWYVRHNDELLIDLDNYERPTKTGGVHGEEFFRLRLQAGIESGMLDVREVWLLPSSRKKHYHAVVLLRHPHLTIIEALVWQMHLGSDLYKGRADLMRAARGDEFPCLLIRNKPIEGFYRAPDATCECTEKHDTGEQWAMGEDACEVWRKYRGHTPWELFGPSPAAQFRVQLPDGKVPLDKINEVWRRKGRQPKLTEKRDQWLKETKR